MVRMSGEGKGIVEKAAALRQVSVSDYVRMVIVPQARRDVELSQSNTISMTPEEQLAFWNALNETPKLTRAQKKLAALMQGKK